MKKCLSILLALILCLSAAVFTACTADKTEPANNSPDSSPSAPQSGDPPVSSKGAITLKDGDADVGSTGAVYENGILSITKAGSYTLTGSTSSGQVVVNVSKTEQVELILDNVSITNPTGPAIYCDSADRLYITVKEGTDNTLKDGTNYTDGENGPNAALYSDDDLTIKGTGILRITALYKNAVSSKNDIKIKDVHLIIDAYNTGIRGKGSVTVESGTLEITAGNDGIKSTEAETQGKGYVTISGGTLTITAGDDAFQAETLLTVSGGTIKATAGGKVTNAPTENITPGIIS